MPTLQLHTPVRFIRGVGPARADQLDRMQIHTVSDVLFLRPNRYEQSPAYSIIKHCQPGHAAHIVGRVLSVQQGFGPRSPLSARVSDGTGVCRIRWFNASYLRSKIHTGAFISATAKVEHFDDHLQMVNPRFKIYDQAPDPQPSSPPPLVAVYPGADRLNSSFFERIITPCLSALDDLTTVDYMTPAQRSARGLMTWTQAIRELHRPTSLESAERARQRLAYDELLVSQLAFQQRRRQRHQRGRATQIMQTPEIDRRIRRRFPFVLTAAQDQAVREIASDMGRAQPMFRLLQGDVGCGKTAVAIYAALVAIANKQQVALLAPTELLARQHADGISAYLSDSAVRCGLLVGSMTAKHKSDTKQQLTTGQLDLIIGTHALLEDDVQFTALGLIIVDEQHRFGVQQKATLKGKGNDPHYLILSATPIPRTQAIALCGELDISIIDGKPPGRGTVRTRVVNANEEHVVWETIRSSLSNGRQAYLVYPLIDVSDKTPLRAVTAEMEKIITRHLDGFRCALLHGRMSAQDKKELMSAFAHGDVDVLASTTVIEVGIDVPNATVMAVFDAQQYGLSQLHQLRGRIGRGGHNGFFLMVNSGSPHHARERLDILTRTHDGFEIAEADLRLRGPGEPMGKRQHGFQPFRFVELSIDHALLQAAQENARGFASGNIEMDKDQDRFLKTLQKQLSSVTAHFLEVA